MEKGSFGLATVVGAVLATLLIQRFFPDPIMSFATNLDIMMPCGGNLVHPFGFVREF
jgi:hypothetical protein